MENAVPVLEAGPEVDQHNVQQDVSLRDLENLQINQDENLAIIDEHLNIHDIQGGDDRGNVQEAVQEKGRIVERSESFEYFVIGLGRGKEGTPHLQGYLEAKTRAGFGISGWKSRFPFLARAHLERSQGDRGQNDEYCSKHGIWIKSTYIFMIFRAVLKKPKRNHEIGVMIEETSKRLYKRKAELSKEVNRLNTSLSDLDEAKKGRLTYKDTWRLKRGQGLGSAGGNLASLSWRVPIWRGPKATEDKMMSIAANMEYGSRACQKLWRNL